MEDTSKRITISVMVNVSLVVDADIKDGEVDIVRVVSLSGLPSPREVIESLSGNDDLAQLDDAYEEAGGELP